MNNPNRDVPLNSFAAIGAGLCWAGSVAVLIYGNIGAERFLFAPQRLVFYALVLMAGVLTFLPLEGWLGIDGLTLQGVGGTAMLAYTVAFVPAPSEWLLYLPDLPVYVLLLMSLFLSVSAFALPFIVVVGERTLPQRVRARDIRRSRRQSYEIGLLVAAILALAALRVLTWVSLLLLVLILVIAELLFLSQVKAEG
jgi:hypothetical protein